MDSSKLQVISGQFFCMQTMYMILKIHGTDYYSEILVLVGSSALSHCAP